MNVDTADLEQLAAAIRAAGVRSVDFDPAAVTTPGVWLRVDEIAPATLDHGTDLTITAFPVVAGVGVLRDLAALSQLLDQLVPALEQLCTRVGPATTTGLVLPGSSKPLPALAVPAILHTVPTPDPS